MHIKYFILLLISFTLGIASGKTVFSKYPEISSQGKNVYTLYRDNPYLTQNQSESFEYVNMRVHIATFDSDTLDTTYNESLCNRVKGFFETKLVDFYGHKPEYASNFWCEKGYYKK